MLFRDNNGNLIEILKYNYTTDLDYYRYIYKNIYNIKYIDTKRDVMYNIIKLIKK